MKARILGLNTVILKALIRGHITGVVLNVWQVWDGLKQCKANILMNPFSNDSDYFDLHAIPSIVINPRKSGSKFGALINPNYTVSIQGNPKYSCFREENYMKLIGVLSFQNE